MPSSSNVVEGCLQNENPLAEETRPPWRNHNDSILLPESVEPCLKDQIRERGEGKWEGKKRKKKRESKEKEKIFGVRMPFPSLLPAVLNSMCHIFYGIRRTCMPEEK